MLSNASHRGPIRPGRRLRRAGASLALALLAAIVAIASAARDVSAAPALGSDRVLTILTEWPSAPRDDVTQPAAQALVGTTVNAWFREVSDKQFAITAKTTPWLKLADANPCGDSLGYRRAALAAAKAAGYNEADYDHVVLYSTKEGCPNATYLGRYVVLLRGALTGRRLLTHELGHNLGLAHSNVLLCERADETWLAPMIGDGSSCASFAQGDVLDTMGLSVNGSAGQYNAVQQQQLGWLGGGRLKVAPTGRTTYTLQPLETVGTGLQAIKATAKGGREYWLEFRQAKGADSYLSMPVLKPVTTGVTVHTPAGTTPGYRGSWLLDMSADKGAFSPIRSGKRWTDPTGKLTVEVGSLSSSGVKVRVTVRS